MLAKSQFAVYDMLFRHGPLTRNEIDTRCSATGKPNPAYSRRLVELEERGVLCRNGTKTCSVSGFECDAWDVTDRMPTPKLKQKRASARNVLRDLAKDGPYFDSSGDCVFCEEKSRAAVGHKDTCAWKRAKEITDP